MSDDVALAPEVARVAAALELEEATRTFGIPDAKMVELARALATERPRAARELLCEHLLALICKYERLAREQTRVAVAQLIVLLMIAAEDHEGAMARAKKAGVGLDGETKKLLALELGKVGGRTSSGPSAALAPPKTRPLGRK